VWSHRQQAMTENRGPGPFPYYRTSAADVKLLVDGEEAYPSMLHAITRARSSIYLATYHFDDDRVGNRFLRSLAQAKLRGVDVRLLVDGMGAIISRPSIVRRARASGLAIRVFNPISWLPGLNRRYHRKILVVDGKVGFIGGMNIRDNHLVRSTQRRPVADVAFRLVGAVSYKIQEIFLADWDDSVRVRRWRQGQGTERERHSRRRMPVDIFPTTGRGGEQSLEEVFVGFLGSATSSVKIISPYFFPSGRILEEIGAARIRGVAVHVITAEHHDRCPRLASFASLPGLIRSGCEIWQAPCAPFEHSKLAISDGRTVLIGSANWDPRSMFINREITLRCHSIALARSVNALFDLKRERLGDRATLRGTTVDFGSFGKKLLGNALKPLV